MQALPYIAELIYKHLTNDLSEKERNELEEWLQDRKDNELFFAQFTDAKWVLKEANAKAERLQEIDITAAWEKFRQRLPPEPINEGYTGKLYRFRILKVTAAAAVILFISGALWLGLRKNDLPKEAVVKTEVVNDAQPKSKLARIVLDDGQEIILDSVGSGVISKQGNVTVIRQSNGAISYKPEGTDVGGSMIYNTVYVPKGGDVVFLTLEDGSKVWLNAESSIRYPIAFNSSERKVTITGEAYFEIKSSVASDGQKKSFIVNKGSMNVVVLGTKFNINTYENEANIKVTLLEGSVKVQNEIENKKVERTIKPGQQAILSATKIQLDDKVDIEQVMAWKNGKFVFRSTNIQLIMRQMARWYDLDSATYKNDEVRTWEFTGEISRYNNASNVLQLLEQSGGGNFKIEGKKIIISK
jgi:transmembrane sensor